MGYWIALALAIFANVGANIAFAKFVRAGDFERSWSSVSAALMQPVLWKGIFFGFMLLGCYLYSIKGIPLSVAYTTATSLSIVCITIAGAIFFGEIIALQAILGVGVVLIGVFMIAFA